MLFSAHGFTLVINKAEVFASENSRKNKKTTLNLILF